MMSSSGVSVVSACGADAVEPEAGAKLVWPCAIAGRAIDVAEAEQGDFCGQAHSGPPGENDGDARSSPFTGAGGSGSAEEMRRALEIRLSADQFF